jgi:nitrogen fixation/metabolism regulation signal transduction histidine kinase
MSIRVRLIVMCLVVALLPAVPLTFLVKSLIDKSFDVGLNPAVEQGLQSGLSVSRRRLEDVRSRFFVNVQRVCESYGAGRPDSAEAVAGLAGVTGARESIDGLIVSDCAGTTGAIDGVPAGLECFADHPVYLSLVADKQIIEPRTGAQSSYVLFDTGDRSVFMAVWDPAYTIALSRPQPSTPMRILFYRRNSADFLADANRIIEARQKFAELRLTQRPLAKSFFFPFVIIYSVCLVIALGLAWLMAERLAGPIRRLERGAGQVAGGDWNVRVDVRTGGETGRLVTAFNTMVRRLDSQRRRLTEMEKMATWRDMARHLAHEIKNPLLPIRLTVEELRDQYRGDDPQYRSMLEDSARVVGDELGSLQNLVKQFSAFAKMPDMNPVPGSLDGLLRDVTRLYTQIKIDLGVESRFGEIVFDRDQIRRVLVNLLDNAVSVGATEVSVTAFKTGDEAVLTVADNGPGIAPEHINRIFEPYYTTRKEGTGLGLAMVNKIVLLHGGSIIAANRAGAGASFEIRLPVSGPATPPPGGDTKE